MSSLSFQMVHISVKGCIPLQFYWFCFIECGIIVFISKLRGYNAKHQLYLEWGHRNTATL